MRTKKAYTLEELILYLEALEMLDMVYKVEKHPVYKEEETGDVFYHVWVIEYEQGDLLDLPSAIQFED